MVIARALRFVVGSMNWWLLNPKLRKAKRVCYESFYNLLVNKFMRLKLQGWALSLTS
jgi:hypothetical protein